MNEFVEQFIIECRELIAQATDDLLALIEQPQDQERLDAAFRAFHTLKGSAGIVEFPAMERTLHVAENVLSVSRTSLHYLSSPAVDECLACLDLVGAWLDEMQTTGELPISPDRAADDMAKRLADTTNSEEEERLIGDHVSLPGVASSGGMAKNDLIELRAISLLEAQIQLLGVRAPEGFSGRLLSAVRSSSNVLRYMRMPAVEIDNLLARAVGPADPDVLISALKIAIDQIIASTKKPSAEIPLVLPTRSLRVGMGRIDALVRIVSELVVIKNTIGHSARTAGEVLDAKAMAADLQVQYARLDRAMGDLQNAVLRIRVLPVGQVFRRFPRVVREIANSAGKSVRLTTDGDSTEADATIVEALFEPLVHVLRNAVDHGIEQPSRRLAAGKSETGTISLTARRDQGNVIIEIADDGQGVDISRIREVAKERSLVAVEILERMRKDELVDLIFAPGFTTARAITELSGRGVGMDSVRTIAAQLGGHVSMTSEFGKGSTVRFVLPFTLLMTRLMTVEAANQIFGLPLDVVVETVLVPRDKIVPVHHGNAFVLRDRTVPVLNLARTLGLPTENSADGQARVVVALSRGQLAGLEVERFGERMDVMLKPMDGLLKGVNGVAGTTLLGDGRVLIVLDVQELFD